MTDPQNLAPKRILAVTEQELSQIVLDIHDGPVQYLFTALSLLSQINPDEANSSTSQADNRVTLNKVTHLIEESLHEIKSFLGTFRPPEFHNRLLKSLLEGIVLQHEEWSGCSVELNIEEISSQVELPSKIAIYRILQEALSNAYRHSGTDKQRVHVWQEDEHICLTVEDNGKGFAPPHLEGAAGTEREEHIGLRGMRDRVSLLEGSFKLSSQPGKGTTISVRIPVNG